MKPTKGISVDGSCLGNPGTGEYRGVDIETGQVLFGAKFNRTTNNIMEFCGIVHALKFRKENQAYCDHQIYSDSEIAIAWINKKKANSSLQKDQYTEKMYEFISRCETWLSFNTKNSLPVSKWITSEWGEIPADFGNKNKQAQGIEVISKASLKLWIDEEIKKDFTDQSILLRKLKKDFNL